MMRIVLSTSLLLHSSAAGAKNTPPGFDYLGYGYDILTGNPMDTQGFGDQGWKNAIYSFTYKDGKTTPDGKWNVPDKCTAQPVFACSSNITNNTFSSIDGYRKDLNGTFAINASYENSSALPNPHLESIAFQFSIDWRNVNTKTTEDATVFVQEEFTCAAYKLESGLFAHPDLDENFVAGVRDFLPEEYNQQYYMTFIEQFGTHLVTGLTSGGRWGLQTEFSKHDLETLHEDGVDVDLGLKVQAEVAAGFHIGVQTENYAYHKVNSLKHSSVNYNIGGTFDIDPAKWNQTVRDNPMPFHLELTDISMLFNPLFVKGDPKISAKRKNMVKALGDYCAHLQKTVDSSVPCHKAFEREIVLV